MSETKRQINLIENLFGETASYEGRVLGKNQAKKICRNEHRIFRVRGEKIITKFYENPESARREKSIYTFLEERNLAHIPKLYYADERILITAFINSGKYDLEETILDWARIHSETLGIEETRIEHNNLETERSNIRTNSATLGKLETQVSKRLSRRTRQDVKTLTHGDLYENNILTNSKKNFYIDFEKSGISHPAKDLSLLLFNSPELKEKIINQYRKNINFDYSEIEEDIETYLVLRLAQIIIGLDKDKHLPQDFRNHFTKKAKQQLKTILKI